MKTYISEIIARECDGGIDLAGRKELELVSLDPLAMGNFTLVGSKGPISLRLELAKAQLAGQSALNLHSVK